MKKIFFLLFCFFFSFGVVLAASRYDIIHDYMDITIKDGKDLVVKELVVLKGDVFEFHKSLLYRDSRLERHEDVNLAGDLIYNATGLDNISIYSKVFTGNKVRFSNIEDSDYKPLTRVYFKEDVLDKGYIESSMQDGKNYRLYYNAKDSVVGFLFEYTLKDVLVYHRDIAELNYLFLPSLDEEVSNLEIRVHVGEEVDYFKMWAHGDLSSQVSYIDDQAIAVYSKLSKNTKVSFRLVFSYESLEGIKLIKQSNQDALKKILELEDKKEKNVSVQKKQKIMAHKVIVMVDALFISFLLVYFIFVFFKYDREFEVKNISKYSKKINHAYGIEVLDAFWHKRIRPQAFMESLFSLILAGKIEYNNKSFRLLSRDALSSCEEVLVDIVFDRLGKKEIIKEDMLVDFFKNLTTNKTYYIYYMDWQSSVQRELDRQSFYEKNGLPIISSVFLLLMSVFVLFASVYFKVDFIFSFFNVCASVLFMIYTFMISKKSKKGALEYAKWNALKNFLADFRIEAKKKDYLIFKEYLIYSMVFDLQEELYKDMESLDVEADESLLVLFQKFNEVLK